MSVSRRRCPWNQPDQRTPNGGVVNEATLHVAVLGTNLINGHVDEEATRTVRGFCRCPWNQPDQRTLIRTGDCVRGDRRRCPWNQPDQRTPLQLDLTIVRQTGRCPWNQPDQRTLRCWCGLRQFDRVAVLGTNLINGHLVTATRPKPSNVVAVLGTNLINGHLQRWALQQNHSRRCPWNQPDQRTPDRAPQP